MSLLMSPSTNPSSSSSSKSAPAIQLEPQTNQSLVFDSNYLQKQQTLPNQFVWPHSDIGGSDRVVDELNEPLVDLRSPSAPELVRRACLRHGFFQVVNHGVDSDLIFAAHKEMDAIFGLSLSAKLAARRKPGSLSGYSGAHADRYSSKLPWKETFSFPYNETEDHDDDESDRSPVVVDYFNSVLGCDFDSTGRVYQRYCKAMRELSLVIMEVLGVSLGVDRLFFRKFFEDSHSIMRCNFYPPCNNSGLTLGTGPHSDPTSLTILHQDQVGGLEVFVNNKWHSVRPRPEALVINIGDTFVALSNGRYKSCLHRAVVNREKVRRSLVFFVSPREDKVVKPPKDLVINQSQRVYPDFTWSDLLYFTQNHYRADVSTLQTFIHWLRSSKPTTTS